MCVCLCLCVCVCHCKCVCLFTYVYVPICVCIACLLHLTLTSLPHIVLFSLSPTFHHSKPPCLPPSHLSISFCVYTTLSPVLPVNLQGGLTALFVASEINLVNVVKLLIDKGADVNISNNVRYISKDNVCACMYVCVCVCV